MPNRTFKDKYGCEIEDLVRPLMRRAWRLGLTSYPQDAEDLTYRTLAALDDYEPTEAIDNVKGYACTVLVRLHRRDRRRSESKYSEPVDLSEPLWDRRELDGPTVEDQAMGSLVRRAIETAVDALTPAQRKVVVLRLGLNNNDMVGMQFSHIGEELGITEEAARQRYRQAVIVLKRLLADMYDGPDTNSNEERPA